MMPYQLSLGDQEVCECAGIGIFGMTLATKARSLAHQPIALKLLAGLLVWLSFNPLLFVQDVEFEVVEMRPAERKWSLHHFCQSLQCTTFD